jgi:tetratricopeptide (TPR) repeat protein
MQSDIEVGEMLTSIDTPRVTVAPFSRSFVGLRAMTSPHEPSEEDDTQSEIDKEARRAIRNGLQRAAQQLKVRVLRHRMVLTGVTCLFLFPIISFLAVRGELENKLLTSIESELSLGQFRKAQADAERGLKEFPNQALLHLYNGQALAKLGRKSDALKEMNFAAKARPDDLKLVAMRAKLLTELGDFKSALLAYQWLTAAHYGNQASNLADKAKVEIMLADAKTALVDLNNALKLEPGNTSFYARRAQAHTNLGDYASAIEDWNTVLKAHPQDAIAYAGRARCKYQTGQELADLAKSLTAKDNAQGKALLAMAIGKYQQALDDLNYLITRAPGKPDLRLLRAQCYENLGDYSAAYHDYSFLIGSTPKPSSDLYLKRAKAAAQERKYNVAKTDLGCAIALDDKAFDAYMLRGDLSLLQNRRQDALLDYNRALTLAPGNLSVKQKIDTVRLKLPQSKTPRTGEAGEWTISQDMVKRDPLNAAYQLMVHDQLAQAVLILGDLIKKEPNNLLARRYLAWSCTELQSPEAAIEQFKIIDRFDSLNAIDRAKYDSCLQQIQIQNQTDTDNSPEKLLHAIQADPNNLVLREELCRVYRDLKQYDKCQQAAEEALLVAKDNQQAKFFFDMIKFVHSKK